MNKKLIKRSIMSAFVIMLLIISGFISIIIFEGILDKGGVKGATIIVDCNGSGDYDSIQNALNAAGVGDMIFVWAGIYDENIIIDKSVTLIGNGTIETILNGESNVAVVQITANQVKINGFTIQSNQIAKTGILLTNVNNCNISDNNCSNNINGIYINNSKNNIIVNNTFMNCDNGIVIDNSESNIIDNNTLISCGIYLTGHTLSQWNTHDIYDNNTVNGKPIYYWKNINVGIIPSGAGQIIIANCQNITIEYQDLSNGSIGIMLGFSNNNIIRNNTCNLNNKFGIYLFNSKLNLMANNICNVNQWDALELITSKKNTIINNTCLKNNDGINLFDSNSNTIVDNTCNLNNDDGIWLAESNSNVIINNTCNFNNDDGIDIYESNSNIIINNTCNLDIDYGIVFQNTKTNKIINNMLISCGLHIIGYLLSQYDSHIIYINNTVNGRPLYYWKNVTTGSVPAGAGQVILVNCSNVIVENQILSNGSTSIELFFSDYNNVKNNLCNRNNNNGIYLWRSDHNSIINNNCNFSFYHGVLLSESHSNTIRDNTCNSNINQGVYLKYSRSNTIINNICNSNNGTGILPRDSNYNAIEDNTCNANKLYGLYLDKSDSNTVINNICNSNNYDGIWIGLSKSNTINNNTCNSNNYCGLELDLANTNTIVNNTCNSNIQHGFLLLESNSNTIIKNICLGNDYGIRLSHSRSNNIENNNCSLNGFVGIQFDNAELNIILNNSCTLNTWVGIELLNSDWNEIETNTCILTDVGIYFYQSHNNIITSNKCKFNNYFGIYLKESTSNTIINNICCINAYHGIFLFHSGLNRIENNNLSNNQKGIYLNSGSYNNVFFENMISNNSDMGISIRTGCNQNRFFHNNIITNVKQAEEETIGFNYWDNGNGEGNYWSNYLGIDNGAGGRVAGDGIGDTEIPHLSLDNYPFVYISGWLFPGIPILKTLSTFDPDGNYSFWWNETRSTTSYLLEEDTSSTFNSPVIFNTGWIFKDLLLVFNVTNKAEGTYYYRLKAKNEQYESDWSNTISITVDYPPIIPQNFRISVYPEGNALNLSWELNPIDTKEYELYFKNDTSTDWNNLENIAHPGDTYNHTNLIDDQIYYYKIRSKDKREQYSNFSEIISGIPADSLPPTVPTGLTIVKTTNDSITLVWNANTDFDIEGYNIYRSTTGNPNDWVKPINSTIKGNERYIDTNLDKRTIYYYVITAFDEVPNESSFSKMVTGITIPGQRLPEINNSIADFEIVEDTVDNTTINLYYWFKDMNNDPLMFRCDGQAHLNVTIHQKNGTVILTPEKNWNGQETLIFYANDSIFEISDNVTIFVIPVNDPPGPIDILTPKDEEIFEYGELINFTAYYDDPDLPYGDKLFINWSSNIAGELGENETLINISLTPGKHLITLMVSDLVGEKTIATVNITVLDISTDKDTGPDKTEDSLTLILISVTIGVMILIILLFIFPGLIYPGWRRIKEKIKKKEETTSDLEPSATPTGKAKKSEQKPITQKLKESNDNIEKPESQS